MSRLSEQWIPIFRAGDFGDKGAYDASKLDQMVSNYDPSFHEAPAVIGHPKDDAPAYGWVEALRRDGDTLFAKLKQVQPQFEEMVRSGSFKKRSVSIYETPKGWSLRHVGFLGAQPPEVKGLADAVFHDGENRVVEITFEESAMAAETKTVKDQIREFFTELFGGGGAAPQTFSESQVAKMMEAQKASFDATLAAHKAEIEALSTKFAEREAKIATGETANAAATAINGLRGAGKWLPAFDRMGLGLVFAELAKAPAVIEFKEGDVVRKQTALELLAGFLHGLPRVVPTGVVFSGGAPAATASAPNTNGRSVADPNSVQLNDLAKKRQAEKGITFGEALTQVSMERPELTVPGGAAGGAV